MSAEDLTRKRRIRGGHKASATKIITKVEELAGAPVGGTSGDKSALQQMKLSLNEKLETLKRLDAEILDLTEDDKVTEEIEQADSFKEDVYRALVRVDQLIGVATPVAPPVSVTHPTSSSPVAVEHRVRLPKINMKSFNGDLTTWTPFWESYASSVHDNPTLSDVDKFTYLKTLLEGSACEAVSGLALTSANYHEAIAILEKRFGNKQQIINRHMEVLLNLESVLSPNSLRRLRRLYDQLESHVRSLKSLGVDSKSYGSLLSSVLLNKLPSELRLAISRNVSEKDWNFDNLMREIEREIEARERVQSSPGNASQATTYTSPPKRNREPSTAATLLTTNVTCCFCQQSHLPATCKTIVGVEARKEVLRKTGRCFSCLKRGHRSRECRSRIRCSKCSRKHHLAICPDATAMSGIMTSTGTPGNPATASTPTLLTSLNPEAAAFVTPTSTSLLVATNKTVMLQTAKATIFNPVSPELPMQVRLILDPGSQRSYITRGVSEALSLETGGEQAISIVAFGSDAPSTRKCAIVTIGLNFCDGSDNYLQLLTVPSICGPLTAQPISLCVNEYDHLSHLELADSPDGTTDLCIDVLIGADYYWDIVTGDIRRGREGPTAIHTKLGWVLSGPGPRINPTPNSHNLLVTHTLHVALQEGGANDLNQTLRSFWDLESLGIVEPDQSTYTAFEEDINLKDGRYEVSLPWKSSHGILHDNYDLCVKRLHGLLRRLRYDLATLQRYDSIIREQLDQGIVEVVPASDSTTQPDKVHYLPHHAVIRQDKTTTKLRVVYDASANSTGPSLNECLHVGPKFDQQIFDILQRFRTQKIALTADIEKAFLMISVHEKDRDVLRFLWVNSITVDRPEIVALRFTRVVFGVSSSPFLLNATIRHHLRKYSESHGALVDKPERSIYVDDIICSAQSEEEAYQVYKESKGILKTGGFNLRKFTTNSNRLQNKINLKEGASNSSQRDKPADDTYANSTLGVTQTVNEGEQKILGVRWNVAEDQFIIDFNPITTLAKDLEPTRRNVVSIIGRFYDPLGLASPVVIQFKIFLQELCRRKLGWDQELEGELLQRWCHLTSALSEGPPVIASRYLFNGISQTIESCHLCGFCDASKNAYAAVVYLIVRTATDTHVRFVAAKTRVSPLQQQSIPRLELLSAVILARLMAHLTEILQTQISLCTPVCYTDSQVALYWIIGADKQWKQFVENRTSEIRRLLPITSWNHCAGKDNPADLPSRGLSPTELGSSQLWHHGPKWLTTNYERSIKGLQSSEAIPPECIPEMKSKDRQSHSLFTAETSSSLSEIIDCRRYGTMGRLLRVTAYAMRFISNLRRVDKSECNQTSTLSPAEILHAESLWVREAQGSLLTHSKFPCWKQQLNLFLDPSGVWRCRGRLSNAELPYSTKFPILLPKSHHFTSLIILRAHERVLHNGVKETLTELRSKYWIIRGRSTVRTIVRQCIICRKAEGRPYLAPPPPPLPKFRVREQPPFTYTGVDFAGPLYIKGTGTTAGGKVWICLYTCCIIRAVHLDVVPDLTTASFIRSFKRFTARRGLPTRMISDNGKTFKAAAKTLDRVMQNKEVQRHLAGAGIQWTFNIERAPWWGGIFERMVRSMKRCLKKIIGKGHLNYDELLTAVTEVEMIINSRPLTYVSSEDLEPPLTPSHLLTGRRVLCLPDGMSCQEQQDEEYTVTQDCLTRRMQHLNMVLNRFWQRWRKEYLAELRESHRYQLGHTGAVTPVVGDVVLIHDDKPRGLWRLGRVEDTIVGLDGQIRGAVLRVPLGDGRYSSMKRPIQRLYPLEVSAASPESQPTESIKNASVADVEPTVTEPEKDEDPVPARRSTRASALQARDRIRAWTIQDQG